MASKWAVDPPDFSMQFDKGQLEALRVLTRVACGTRGRSYVFPDIEDRKSRGDANKESMRRRLEWVEAKCATNSIRLSRDDIDNFRAAETALDYAYGVAARNAKIKRIYYYIYKYLGEDPQNRSLTDSLVSTVYFQKEASFDRVTSAFQDFLEIDPRIIDRIERSTSGVYYLYRYGAVEHGEVEIVRSIVQIAAQNVEGVRRLQFTLAYKRGRMRDVTETSSIEGLVLPHHNRLFLVAADRGTGASPCLLILEWPTSEKPTYLLGIMLRVNTLGHAAATKIVIKRITTADREGSAAEINDVFQEHLAHADILPHDADETLQELGSLKKYIDNRVDNVRNFMLSDT